mmetsp:Transcript_16849/g.34345  ORF Transcript_16849/g.34345 Transcript_16849/m.34345 type:complete len:141 (-) Transcript_16849:70-492(-)
MERVSSRRLARLEAVLAAALAALLLWADGPESHQLAARRTPAAARCFLPAGGERPAPCRPLPRRLRRPQATAGAAAASDGDGAPSPEEARQPSLTKSLRSAGTIIRRLINIPLSWNGLALFPTFYILGYLSQFLHDLRNQ